MASQVRGGCGNSLPCLLSCLVLEFQDCLQKADPRGYLAWTGGLDERSIAVAEQTCEEAAGCRDAAQEGERCALHARVVYELLDVRNEEDGWLGGVEEQVQFCRSGAEIVHRYQRLDQDPPGFAAGLGGQVGFLGEGGL